MATIEITKENFENTIENNEIVLLDFWASWCGPCQMFGPIFEKVSDVHPDILFGKIDTESQQELAGAFGIQSIPTLMVFRDQIGLLSQPGAVSEEGLEDVIRQVRELDMNEVREQIAKHEAEHNGCGGSGCNCE